MASNLVGVSSDFGFQQGDLPPAEPINVHDGATMGAPIDGQWEVAIDVGLFVITGA